MSYRQSRETYPVVESNFYSYTVFKYNFEVLVLYLSISILSYFILLLISKGNIVLFTPLLVFNNFS